MREYPQVSVLVIHRIREELMGWVHADFEVVGRLSALRHRSTMGQDGNESSQGIVSHLDLSRKRG